MHTDEPIQLQLLRPLELAILHALWRDGPATGRQIQIRVRASHHVDGRTITRSLARMCAYGLITRRGDSFSATHTRAQLLSTILDRLFTDLHPTATERRRVAQALLASLYAL